MPSSTSPLHQKSPCSHKKEHQLSLLSNSGSRQIFSQFSTKTKQSDAILDGGQCHPESVLDDGSRPVKDLINLELPLPPAIYTLIQSYFWSTQFYCIVVHESSFREQLTPILATGNARKSEKPFLMLLLAVIHIGATYLHPDQSETLAKDHGTDIRALQSDIMAVINQDYLDCFDHLTTQHIAFLFLLTTIYLSQKRTKLAFSVLGMAIRGAQSLGLHSEISWKMIDNKERQFRRNLWWSLYMSDGYSAQHFGKPAVIHERDCQVQLPDDLDDTVHACPGFETLELRDNGSRHRVTSWSYTRYKAKLYLIAAPITRDLYRKNDTDKLETIVKRVKAIHRQLLEWERSIPPELRPDSFLGRDAEVKHDPRVRVFALQSLTLQAAYDNIQLLLFRPFIAFSRNTKPHSNIQEPGLPGNQTETLALAREQCWISSMRLSLTNKYPEMFRMLTKTIPFPQWVMWSLTAGVMLGILAMSSPFSSRAGECKRAIARLVHTLRCCGHLIPVSEQTSDILADLTHLVAKQEVEAMMASAEISMDQQDITVPAFGTVQDTRYPQFAISNSEVRPASYPNMSENGTHETREGRVSSPLADLASVYSFNPVLHQGPPELSTPLVEMNTPGHTNERTLPLPSYGFSMDDFMSQTWIWNDEFNLI
ncbi:transcriptional regulatory protein [Paramyrothecium foliicola]|nr:transcriptional regulatory protein [Paramyrothecium foliicola]